MESRQQPGTLSFFKVQLKKTSVNGKVKSNYRAHEDLLLTIGQHMIREQVRSYFDIDGNGEPKKNVPRLFEDPQEQRSEYTRVFAAFLAHYKYGTFNLRQEAEIAPPPVQIIRQAYRIINKLPNGVTLVAPVQVVSVQARSTIAPAEDEVYNYCNSLCHWTMQIKEMSDTANEGDVGRIIPNLMANIPFFYAHSHLSKYFVECLDYILKVRQASPQMASRILEGSFVNTHGGVGRNCEADLKTEHSVANRKKLIKLLGANKTDTAMHRVTNAADTVSDIVNKFDKSLNVKVKSGRHTHTMSDDNEKKILQHIRQLNPFQKQNGRKCEGFPNFVLPQDTINKEKMKEDIARTVERLVRGMGVDVEEEEEEQEAGSDDDDRNVRLPDIL